MGLERVYFLKCDGCGAVHKTACPSPRRARAAAKRDGWQRRKVVVGRSYYPDSDEPDGKHYYDVIAGRDFCPTCLDKMEVE
jgi:hypothetical protein